MFHHHLPVLLSRVANYGRYALDLYHSALRVVELGLCRLNGTPHRLRRGPPRSNSGRLVTQTFSRKLRRQKPLLIHYHIFKNAGTSFEWALEQALGNTYRSFDSPVPSGFTSPRELTEFAARNPEVRVISSHQAAPPPPRIRGREIFTSILIRDPIARIRSIYAFERRQEAITPGAIKAKELNFKEYVEWRLSTSPAMLCNFQVHFCSRTAENGMLAPGQEQLQRAIANLDTISIVGTVARYKEWLALAQKILSGPFPHVILPASRRNVTVGDDPSEAAILEELISELGDDTAQYLLENNQLDMCLHQVADALLTRRLAEHGVGVALHQAYASVQKDRRLSRDQVSNPDP